MTDKSSSKTNTNAGANAQPPSPQEPQVTTNVKGSVGWSLLTRWSSKGLGMINTIVLARLLTPEDFGIVGIATLFLGMLESMTQVGVHLYVFRQKGEDSRLYNSAWTVTIIQGAVVALALLLAAPFIAEYYGKPVLTQIIYCLALVKLITGFQNFGIFIAQKKLNFRVDFKVTFVSRLVYFVSTVSLAVWLQNYWALIFGQLILAVALVTVSFMFHPFRPRFSLFQWRNLLKFSTSTVPMSTGRFLNNQADTAVVSKAASTEYFGQYHLAFNLGQMFTKELLMPVIKGMLPNLTAMQGTPQFKQTFLLVCTVAVYIFLPIGFGLSAVATEFVAVLLGPKWTLAAPILAWLSLYTMMNGVMMFVSEQFLIVMSYEKLSNRLMWFRNTILVLGIGLTFYVGQVDDIPKALVLIALVTLPLIIGFVARKLEVSFFYFVQQWWPPVLSAILMWAAIAKAPWPDWHLAILLVLKVLVGVMVYGSALSVIYLLRGQPSASPERLIMSKVLNR